MPQTILPYQNLIQSYLLYLNCISWIIFSRQSYMYEGRETSRNFDVKFTMFTNLYPSQFLIQHLLNAQDFLKNKKKKKKA